VSVLDRRASASTAATSAAGGTESAAASSSSSSSSSTPSFSSTATAVDRGNDRFLGHFWFSAQTAYEDAHAYRRSGGAAEAFGVR
jgi:hypothetical protein